MKLLSFVADGKELFGAVSGDGVVTLNDRVGQPSLRAALAAGAMDAMRKAAQDAKPDRKLADIKFLPVIPHPEKILCAGVNYRAHASEVGRELPKQPSMFIRFTDTLVGHDGAMIRPSVSDNFDYEGELALVIGKSGRHIEAEDALDHIAGYTILVDGSVRDFQKFSVTSGKNFPGTGPLGPWLVTTDEISRSEQAHLDDAAERPAGPACRHRQADLFDPTNRRLLLRLHRAFGGRRHRHRHARRRRPQPKAAAVDEAG